jgi:hypothetical protein
MRISKGTNPRRIPGEPQSASPATWNWANAFGPLSNAMEPGIQCARTHWIRGFMTFQLVRSSEP